ncbi:MAG: hypothetical protein K2L13_02080 [Opitutales bacterium]|nr:hypothetical protein [Opitutales bacterium]
MSSVLLQKPSVYYGVRQFTIFLDKKNTLLNTVLTSIHENGLTLIAFSSNETYDYLILRIVTNYADKLVALLKSKNIYFSEQLVLAAEFLHSDDIAKIVDTISSAEIGINYFYPLLSCQNNKLGLILSVEDIDLASKALSQSGITIISQNEIDR